MHRTKSAILALTLGLAFLSAPAMASSDYGLAGGTPTDPLGSYNTHLSLFMGGPNAFGYQVPPGYQALNSSGVSTGSDGSSSATAFNVGSLGGVTYTTGLTFNASVLPVFYGSTVYSAQLFLNYQSVTATPITAAVTLTQDAGGLIPYAGLGIPDQSFTLQASSSPGTQTVDLSPAFTQALTSVFTSNTFSPTYVHVALSAVAPTQGGGAGAPGPVAGAGLPFLAAAGLAWTRRRLRARTGS